MDGFLGAALRNTTCEEVMSAGLGKERLNCDAATAKAQSIPQKPDGPSNLFQTGARKLRLHIPRSPCHWRLPQGKGHNLEGSSSPPGNSQGGI